MRMTQPWCALLAGLPLCACAQANNPQSPNQSPPSASMESTGPTGQALAEVPEPHCQISEEIDQFDVRWHLATRPEAPPSMRIFEGKVRARLTMPRPSHDESSTPLAIVEVANPTATIRAFSATPLQVTLREHQEIEAGSLSFIADRETAREVVSVQEGRATIAVSLESLTTVVQEFDCSVLGLVRRPPELSSFLPPVVEPVRLTAGAESTRFDHSKLHTPNSVAGAQRRSDQQDGKHLISFTACGGVVYDYFAPGEFETYTTNHGSSRQPCPNGRPVTGVLKHATRDRMSCPTQLRLFLRTPSMTDEVGTLHAHSRFGIIKADDEDWTTIRLETAPVDLSSFAKFVVASQDLKECQQSPPAND